MHLNFVISHVFRMDLTHQCLDSIPDTEWVYLIDNSQTGEAKAYAHLRRAFIHYIRPDKPPLSYAASLNLGIESIKEPWEWVVLANNDLIFSYPHAFVLFKTLAKTDKPIDLFVMPFAQGQWACVMLSRNAWERVGKFDEQFKPCAGEDDDYWVRFCRADLKWAQPQPPFFVWHAEGGHHSRIDNGQNISRWEKKYKMKYGSEEHQKIIQSGLYKDPKIWTPK